MGSGVRPEFIALTRNHLGVLGVSITKADNSEAWKKLFHSSADPALTGCWKAHVMRDDGSLEGSVEEINPALRIVYAPSDQAEYNPFEFDLKTAMKVTAEADNFILNGYFNLTITR